MDKEIIKDKVMSLEYGLAELAQLLSEGGQSTFKINTVVGSWTWNESTPQPEHKSIEGLRGMTAKVTFKKDSPYNVNGEDEGIFHNLTEVHYNYKSWTGERDSTAFESDIESTGTTIKNKEIEEIEITVEPHLNSRNLLEKFAKWYDDNYFECRYANSVIDEFIESEGK